VHGGIRSYFQVAMTVVLLIDDDEDARGSLTELLEETGYAVLQADNGSAAWQRLEEVDGRCDVILLDLMMPTMNGWDFRRKQRGDPRFAGIPVLLMSSGAHIASVSAELEAADYLSKPVEIADLREKLRKHAA
jgi:CheY-like chemotaxis protein